MFAAAITKGDVTVKNVIPKHLESPTAKLIEMGCQIEESDDAVRVVASRRLEGTAGQDTALSWIPYRLVQPQIGVALAICKRATVS